MSCHHADDCRRSGNTLFTCRGHLASVIRLRWSGTTPGARAGADAVLESCAGRHLSGSCANSPLWKVASLCKLKAFLKAENFDVVHTLASKAGITGRCARAPMSVDRPHGTRAGFPSVPSQLINKAYILAERFAAKRCDKIFAVARAVIDQCVNAKVAPDYKVVYSGMDLDAFLNAGATCPEAAWDS